MSALETVIADLTARIAQVDTEVAGQHWRFRKASPGTYGYDSVLIDDGRKVAGVIAKWPAGAAEYIAAASPVNVALVLAEVTRLRRRVDELLAANNREVERRRAVVHAGLELYLAGRWSCDRPVDEARLWSEFRDALGVEPGTATRMGMGDDPNGPPRLCASWWRFGAMAMRDAIVARLEGSQGELFALTARDVPLPAVPRLEEPKPSIAGTWGWYAGNNSEWYAVGPYETRDQAIKAGRANLGDDVPLHLVEACTGDIRFDADAVIVRFLENEAGDLFDADHAEADRAGPGTEQEAADLELQKLLDEWVCRWRHTFAKPNIFAATRNEEVVAPLTETAA